MSLMPKLRQELKAKAHNLKPIVMIGFNGLTESVILEIERALYDHELIKVKISSADRDGKESIYQAIASQCQAEKIQLIGNIGVFYRKRSD